ncbi:MAG: Spy/CpxP family protein refolding chaperone [Acidobacteria bacterium]|nr:Spy/CpxP family protein refolding chaperone [Acidobacteriota bacterium]
MKKIIVAILAVALVAIGAIFVLGQSKEGRSMDGKREFGKRGHHGKFGRSGKRGMRGGMMGMGFRGVELTDAQKEQLKAIRKASFEATKPLMEEMRANQLELRKLGENGNFDESAVSAIASKQGAIHAKLIVAKQKAQADSFAVLTAEQKAKIAEMKANFAKKMEERKAKWAEKRGSKKADQQ